MAEFRFAPLKVLVDKVLPDEAGLPSVRVILPLSSGMVWIIYTDFPGVSVEWVGRTIKIRRVLVLSKDDTEESAYYEIVEGVES